MGDGVAPLLAHDVAKHEAAARQRVSWALGFREAERAELVLIETDAGPKLALMGSTANLRQDQLDRLPKAAKFIFRVPE